MLVPVVTARGCVPAKDICDSVNTITAKEIIVFIIRQIKRLSYKLNHSNISSLEYPLIVFLCSKRKSIKCTNRIPPQHKAVIVIDLKDSAFQPI